MQLKSCAESVAQNSEHESRIRDLFPLPLAPFELFMLLDDRPELPMTFCVELVFRGTLDRDAFQTAVDESVSRHPLLRAHVAWAGRRPEWKLPEFRSVSVNWLQEPDRRFADEIRPIDLRQEAGLRVFAEDGSSFSRVWFHFHHACCDGMGARRFVVDLITGYARACDIHPTLPAWDELDYESLRRRHEFAVKTVVEARAATSIWKKLQDAFHFHVLTPRPLSRVPSAIDRPHSTTPIQKHVFDWKESARIFELARDTNASLNDIAIGLLFVTLANWNRRFDSATPSQRLRVLMPTDLRSVRDARMPAANRMSFSFLARTIGQCSDSAEFLAGIRSESKYIQQLRLGLDFLGGIALAQHVPGLLPLLMRLPRCLATAVLTNSGDLTKRFRRRFPVLNDSPVVGNLILDQVFGTPPVRPFVNAGFGLCICSRQLCISMIGNEQVLGDQTNELLRSYVDQWRLWGKLP